MASENMNVGRDTSAKSLPVPLASVEAPIADAGGVRASWEIVRSALRADLGEQVYSSWFARMDAEAIVDGAVQLSVPTRVLKTWIQTHYNEKLVLYWTRQVADVRRVDVSVRGSTAPSAPAGATAVAARPAAAAAPRPVAAVPAPSSGFVYVESEPGHPGAPPRPATDDGLGSPIDRRMTFPTFVVGRSNAIAHAAATTVANAGPHEAAAFNPLFVHAAVGHGKTHLAHAIAHEARANGRRVVYLTAEKFMYGFVQALKSGGAIAFKEQVRGIDLLLIDDIQFLQGQKMQAEFTHTLNALLDGSRQVVIACDRAPGELETLDERLRSRLSGGLVVEISGPDQDMRERILKGKLETARERYPNLSVPDAVVAYVAHAVATNGRDLDGALNRLVAHNQFSGATLSVDSAEDVLKDMIRVREPKRVKIEDIQRICAKHYNVSRQDLLSSRRTRNVVMPRQIAMYLAKSLTLRSLPEIGRRFGGRDHTTVLHAVRKIEDLVGSDGQLSADIELIKRLLTDA